MACRHAEKRKRKQGVKTPSMKNGESGCAPQKPYASAMARPAGAQVRRAKLNRDGEAAALVALRRHVVLLPDLPGSFPSLCYVSRPLVGGC